jgi:hypothetical protein
MIYWQFREEIFFEGFLSNKIKIGNNEKRLMRAHPIVMNFRFHKNPHFCAQLFEVVLSSQRDRPSFLVSILFPSKKIAQNFFSVVRGAR